MMSLGTQETHKEPVRKFPLAENVFVLWNQKKHAGKKPKKRRSQDIFSKILLS
jgi:hypothetical protein